MTGQAQPSTAPDASVSSSGTNTNARSVDQAASAKPTSSTTSSRSPEVEQTATPTASPRVSHATTGRPSKRQPKAERYVAEDDRPSHTPDSDRPRSASMSTPTTSLTCGLSHVDGSVPHTANGPAQPPQNPASTRTDRHTHSRSAHTPHPPRGGTPLRHLTGVGALGGQAGRIALRIPADRGERRTSWLV